MSPHLIGTEIGRGNVTSRFIGQSQLSTEVGVLSLHKQMPASDAHARHAAVLAEAAIKPSIKL